MSADMRSISLPVVWESPLSCASNAGSEKPFLCHYRKAGSLLPLPFLLLDFRPDPALSSRLPHARDAWLSQDKSLAAGTAKATSLADVSPLVAWN